MYSQVWVILLKAMQNQRSRNNLLNSIVLHHLASKTVTLKHPELKFSSYTKQNMIRNALTIIWEGEVSVFFPYIIFFCYSLFFSVDVLVDF